MAEKLLTINVITYNHSKYISQCLDSLLSQKTDFDFVIRIFDDCSTDGTTEICRQYEQDYPDKIEFYQAEQNLGITKNPKRSYKDIKTKYYMYIEGDDFCCNKSKLQKQIEILENHPDCVFCAHKSSYNGEPYRNYPELTEGVYSAEDVVKAKALFVIHLPSRIVRTSAIPDNEQELNYYLLDTNQMYMLFEKGNLYFIDDVMTTYRVHPNGFWSGNTITNRFNFVWDNYMFCNDYFNSKYEKNIFKHIIADLTIAYEDKYNLEVPSETISNKIKRTKINLKALKHYILPPFIIDILNLPRDLVRFIKSRKESLTHNKGE